MSLEENRVEWDGENNVKQIWEQVKWTMVESAREVCGSLRVGGKNPKSVWWTKEAAWKEVLRARDEDAKERCLKV